MREKSFANLNKFFKNNLSSISLFFILFAAFAVRVWGIKFGLPYLFHPDEWAVVDRALNMIKTADYSPHDFGYPPLYMFVQAAVYVAKFFYGVSANQYRTLNDLTAQSVTTWGRLTTALFGVATVYLLYLLAKRMFSERVSLVAALFLAFNYLHARNSHYITIDVFMVFLVTLSFYFSYLVFEEGKRRDYMLAGLFAGLAIAAKYNAGIIIIALLAAHLLTEHRQHLNSFNLWLGLVAVLVGFYIGTPMIFRELPTFMNSVAAQMLHYQGGHTGYEFKPTWLYYLRYLWIEGLGQPLFVLTAFGLVYGTIKAVKKSKKDILLVLFPVAYYLSILKYKTTFDRTIMVAIPFLLIICGRFLIEGIDYLTGQKPKWQKFKAPAVAIFLLLSLAGPAYRIIQYDRHNTFKSTRVEATEWMEANLPPRIKLAQEAYSAVLSSKIQIVEFPLIDHDINWYKEQNFEYIIFGGYPERFFAEPQKYPREVRLYNDLIKKVVLIKEFKRDPFVEGFMSPPIKIYKISLKNG